MSHSRPIIVNRASGTASAIGCWLHRLVRRPSKYIKNASTLISSVCVCRPVEKFYMFVEIIPSEIADVVSKPLQNIPHRSRHRLRASGVMPVGDHSTRSMIATCMMTVRQTTSYGVLLWTKDFEGIYACIIGDMITVCLSLALWNGKVA